MGYSYRTPDAASDIGGTRSGKASRVDLTRALTQPVADAPPVFGGTVAVPAVPWKSQPSTGHLRGTLVDAAGTSLARHPPTPVRPHRAPGRPRARDARGRVGLRGG